MPVTRDHDPATRADALEATGDLVGALDSLVEAAAYLGDDAHLPQWEARYQRAIQRLQEGDDAGKWSGATPVMRHAGSNP